MSHCPLRVPGSTDDILYRATILIGQWLQTSSVNGRVTAFLTILAGAIRTAQVR